MAQNERETSYYHSSAVCPYTELLDDDDEVLIALAESLKDLVDYIGGAQYIMSLLSPLESLASADETTVRDSAIESIKKILIPLRLKDFESLLKTMLGKMMASESYTSKISCLCICPHIYKNLNAAQQLEIINFFKKCSADEIIQTKKTAALQLKDMINIGKIAEADAISVFNIIKVDVQDSMRMIAFEIALCMAKYYSILKISSHILAFLKATADDKSWRIRFTMADKIVEFSKLFEKEIVLDFFANCYIAFIADGESEVRTAAISKLAEFCNLLDAPTIIKKLIPAFNAITLDSFLYVRKAFAENILQISPLIGAQSTTELLLPLILNLFKDTSSDVKIAIIKGLDIINKVVGSKVLLQAIAPPIISLTQEKSWRIRMQTIENFPMIAKHIGEAPFNEKFLTSMLDGLDDPTYSIREQSIKNIQEITEIFGLKWFEKNALPKITSFSTHANYLFRATVLIAIRMLSSLLSVDIIEGKIVPILTKLASDKIANIRFNVAKSIKSISLIAKDKIVEVLKINRIF